MAEDPANNAIAFAAAPEKAGLDPVNIHEFERHAQLMLPKSAFDYYASGANDMITLEENRAAFNRIRLRPNILRDVSKVDTTTYVLGEKVATPICIAPVAMQRMAHDAGERATAAAAAKTGTIMAVSNISTVPLEDVAKAGGPGGARWFQLYVYKDTRLTTNLVKRALVSGYTAIVVTVDSPVLGKRESDIRNVFALPEHLAFANFLATDAYKEVTKNGWTNSEFAAHIISKLDHCLTWEKIKWLRTICGKMKIVVKGILTAEEASEAARQGVDGIWVSNHGARQLDTTPATIEALPEVVQAVNGRCEVYLDGGICRGTDVFKALALGAKAVFIGRPVLWGLAHSGEEGVAKILKLLNDELVMTLQLMGCKCIDAANRSMIAHQIFYQSNL